MENQNNFWSCSAWSSMQQSAYRKWDQRSVTENHLSHIRITKSLYILSFVFYCAVHSMFAGRQSSNTKPNSINKQCIFLCYPAWNLKEKNMFTWKPTKISWKNLCVYCVWATLIFGKFHISRRFSCRCFRCFQIWYEHGDPQQHTQVC
jgi:hypothetical protein